MITRADISDAILAAVSKDSGKGLSERRRVFISDWELRRLRKPAEKAIRVPMGAIISPLSMDWLEYEGIEVIQVDRPPNSQAGQPSSVAEKTVNLNSMVRQVVRQAHHTERSRSTHHPEQSRRTAD